MWKWEELAKGWKGQQGWMSGSCQNPQEDSGLQSSKWSPRSRHEAGGHMRQWDARKRWDGSRGHVRIGVTDRSKICARGSCQWAPIVYLAGFSEILARFPADSPGDFIDEWRGLFQCPFPQKNDKSSKYRARFGAFSVLNLWGIFKDSVSFRSAPFLTVPLFNCHVQSGLGHEMSPASIWTWLCV